MYTTLPSAVNMISKPVPITRYNRVGQNKWLVNHTLLYNVENYDNNDTYYLVNNTQLHRYLKLHNNTHNNTHNIHNIHSTHNITQNTHRASNIYNTHHNNNTQSMCDVMLTQSMLSLGVDTLEKLFVVSGSLRMHWSPSEHAQFKTFTTSWERGVDCDEILLCERSMKVCVCVCVLKLYIVLQMCVCVCNTLHSKFTTHM